MTATESTILVAPGGTRLNGVEIKSQGPKEHSDGKRLSWLGESLSLSK